MHFKKLLSGIFRKPVYPSLKNPCKTPNRKNTVRDINDNIIQLAIEQVSQALMGHIVIMMWITVIGLQEWYTTIKIASRLENADNFSRAPKWILYMLQHSNRDNSVKTSIQKRKHFTYSTHVGRIVRNNLEIDDIAIIAVSLSGPAIENKAVRVFLNQMQDISIIIVAANRQRIHNVELRSKFTREKIKTAFRFAAE